MRLALGIMLGTLLLAAGCCPASKTPPASGPVPPSRGGPMEEPTITVSAQGEVKATPDQAQFNIQLIAHGKTPDEASQTLNTNAAKLIERLKNEGVPEKDIQTTSIRLHPRYDHNRPTPLRREGGAHKPEPPQIIDYEAAYSVNITLDDLKKAMTLMGGITNAPGIAHVNGPNLGFADTTELEGKALADAVARARKKAEILAREAGMEILEVWRVDTSGGGMPMPRATMMMARAEAAPAPTPIAPGEETFSASVTVTFRVRPAPPKH